MNQELIMGVSDFVGLLNQTLEYAYPIVTIVGELANFRVSKNRWVYFDLKDDMSSVKFFGTIYNLPGPLEDGMMLQVRGMPRLHPNFGFSVTVQGILPVGEGSLKKAAGLLEAQLQKEGLFAQERKRGLPYPPKQIALVTSAESAAYADFVKVLSERWGGIEIDLYDVQVQGGLAVEQIVAALKAINDRADIPDAVVITRGGGSADDLAVFNTEQVTRAVAGSRAPTLVAIGHEVDISLAEMAADQRASTPSNAAQLLTPDRFQESERLKGVSALLSQLLRNQVTEKQQLLVAYRAQLEQSIAQRLEREKQALLSMEQLLVALSPQAALQRGYAILRSDGRAIKNGASLLPGQTVTAQLHDASITATVVKISVE